MAKGQFQWNVLSSCVIECRMTWTDYIAVKPSGWRVYHHCPCPEGLSHPFPKLGTTPRFCVLVPLFCQEPCTAVAQLLTSFCSPNASLQQPLGGAPSVEPQTSSLSRVPPSWAFIQDSAHMGEDRSGCQACTASYGILVSSNTSSSLLLLRPVAAVSSAINLWFTSAFLVCFSPN